MSFRICVVGCGAIAVACHGPSYVKYKSENKDVVFAGCCDIDGAKANGFREQFGFLSAYTDMDEMLAAQKPDAVCLISPVDVTAFLAAKILKAGIPLLLEKPPGRTREETLGLVEIAERKNVPNMVAFNRRYAPLIVKLKEQLHAAPIQSLRYDLLRVGRLDADFSTTAIHAIDAVRFIAGSDYKNVEFTYREYPQLGAGVADVRMCAEMKNGAFVNINICPVTGINLEGAAVNLHDRSMFLDYMQNGMNPSGRLTVLHRNSVALDITAGSSEPFVREGFYAENKTFLDHVYAGRKPTGDLAQSLQSVEAAECIRGRARERHW